MTQNNTKYYLHYDQVGSLRAISDTSGNIVKEITYDTYGNILTDTNANFKVPFGFAGGLLDKDTGLTRFGYRDYDSYTGKWTAKDPIDFSGGDTNLYGYVLGDPVNFVDVDGRNPLMIGGAIAGAAVGIMFSFYDPCTGQFGISHFQGWGNLAINTVGGAAFGALSGGFSNLAVAGLVGGLGTSFLSAMFNYATTTPCNENPSCP